MPDRDERQERFLEVFIESKGSLEESLKTAGLSRSIFFGWLRSDEIFRARFDSYRIALAEDLENEAIQRALKPEGQRGSDALVTTLLKGLKRERYGQEDQQARGGVAVIYVSQLRELPRIGIKEEPIDAAYQIESSGRGIGDQPGDGVPAKEGTPSTVDRNFAGSPRSDAPPGEGVGWVEIEGA